MRGDPAHRAGSIVAVFGFEPELALAIAWCDSGNSSHDHLTWHGFRYWALLTRT